MDAVFIEQKYCFILNKVTGNIFKWCMCCSLIDNNIPKSIINNHILPNSIFAFTVITLNGNVFVLIIIALVSTHAGIYWSATYLTSAAYDRRRPIFCSRA